MTREDRLTRQVDHDLLHGLFHARLLERSDRELRRDGWATAARKLPDLGEPLFRMSSEGVQHVLVEVGDVLLQLGLYSGMVHMVAAAPAFAPIEALAERLRAELPAPDPSSAHEVTVTFWTYGPQGPVPSWRSIAVPSWDEIRDNYAGTTRTELERLMRGFQPAHGGQLVLWHGVAGTGKTFGLRALAWEWRDWCDFHYIVDPDTFFGQHADYLMSVLLQPEYMGGFQVPSVHGYIVRSALQVSDDGDEEDGPGKAWRVLVLEDTGELLTPDAKMVIGQGLSRFLNVVDGLIGQGLRVLVLVTTNEPIKKLHPAVARPGRCAANVEFEALDPQEAETWLEAHGVANGTKRGATLAELFAVAEGRDPSETQLVGFADDGA
ncbi:MAG TPA: DUF5925 domain-containing protein [Gaiellaceae bacterium]|nr:DUF5925 domain-containing protein [Gaiellaceae bacterium]